MDASGRKCDKPKVRTSGDGTTYKVHCEYTAEEKKIRGLSKALPDRNRCPGPPHTTTRTTPSLQPHPQNHHHDDSEPPADVEPVEPKATMKAFAWSTRLGKITTLLLSMSVILRL